MKFDMSAAWNEAIRLIGANRDVLLVVAGVFFFLPYVAFVLLFMNQITALEAAQAANPDPSRMGEAMMGFYAGSWWVFVLLAIVQGIGMLGLLALLTDRGRPTVGEALKIGAKLLLPYIAAQLILSVMMGLIILVPIAIGAGVSVGAGMLFGIVALVGAAYLFTKFLMVSPVIAIERQTNPIAAIGRSWRLSKGNSVRIFLFVFLLMVAVGIVGAVLSMIVGLLLALGGAEAALVGQAIVSGLINAVFYVIFLAVLAAIHRQLAGSAPETIGETFE